ncbi:MAG: DUF2845 domain-containing protein [Polaromonas sp.]|nr:DUF2845 domain-containing protein [Polaromonas sp.]
MNTRHLFIAALLSLPMLAPSGVAAQSLRCKGDLAQLGNSKATILQKCGEPVLKDNFCKAVEDKDRVYVLREGERRPTIQNSGCEPVEEWTYNPGYGQFMTMLQFEGGELKRIKYGDRVTR